jgi:UDP-glucose 4-epimerase
MRRTSLMTILVAGSTGHLGEALMRTLPHVGHKARGIDLKPGAFTDGVGMTTDRTFVKRSICGVEAVIHTATLHKPHIGTHSREPFAATNVLGTLNLSRKPWRRA